MRTYTQSQPIFWDLNYVFSADLFLLQNEPAQLKI